MRIWVLATGGHDKNEMDYPCIKFCTVDKVRDLENWVDKQIVEDLIQFYPRVAIGNEDYYGGPRLEPEDRVRDIFAAIDEEEDTLFTKVKDARAALLKMVMEHITKHEEWQHQTSMESYSGGYVTVELVDITL